MTANAFSSVVSQLRRWSGPADSSDDGFLLAEFLATREEESFAEILRRHGPMVLGVCRRVLGDSADADDVFQATFLVLVRRAATIRRRNSLASWLHGVALRLARRALADSARRREIEAKAPARFAADETAADSNDLRPVLDEELDRLPDKYRRPLLLCYLEGRTNAEAASQLGWPVGTVCGRLARARILLRSRLVRRGVTVSLLAALPADDLLAEVPAKLAATTARIAGLLAAPEAGLAAVASRVAKLVDGATKAASPGRWKIAGAALALFGALTAGIAVVAHQRPAGPTNQPETAVAKPRLDAAGDPLPADAVFRLGTLRWRHEHTISSLTFLPDGRLISGGWDKTVRMWDPATGRELARWQAAGTDKTPNHEAGVSSVAASPDGKTVAFGGMDMTLHFVDVGTGRELFSSPKQENTVITMSWSPDGKMLATGSGNFVHRWDPATFRELPPLPRCPDEVNCVRFSSDSKLLALTCGEKSVRLLDPQSGREARLALPTPDAAGGLCFSPDGKRLAVSCKDKTIHIFDLLAGQKAQSFTGIENGRAAQVFSRDGRMLLAGDMDGNLVWLDVESGREARRATGAGEWVMALAASPDGKTVVGAFTQRALRRWNIETGEELRPVPGHDKRVNDVAFSPDGRTIATAGDDRHIYLWNSATGHCTGDIPTTQDLRTIAWSPDGTRLAAAGIGKVIQLWDVKNRREVRRFTGHTAEVNTVVFSRDGRRLASRSSDSTARVWHVATGTQQASFQLPVAPHYEANAVAFSPDGRQLAADAGNGHIHVFDLTTNQQIHTLPGHRELVNCVAYSPDGKYLVSGGTDGRIIFWDALTGAARRTGDPDPSGVRSLAFSSDGRQLLSCGSRTVRLWEVASGKLRRQFDGHAAGVGRVAFSPDGRRAVSGSDDTTALVWEIRPPVSALIDLEAAWAEMASEDAARAFVAMQMLAAAPGQSAPFLRARLKPPMPADEAKVAGWIADLDSRNFRIRQEAVRQLERLDESARPLLERAFREQSSAEVRQRLKALLERLDAAELNPPSDRLRLMRAAEVLSWVAGEQNGNQSGPVPS
ncbi:MAG: sigma-70 family RNA polymerase sigma factor [Gemmataceae bacterium]